MKSLKSLNKYFLKYKNQLLLGIVFVTLSTLFATYQGVIVRKGTNAILTTIFEKQTPTNYTLFIQYGLIIVALALLSGLFMFLMRQTIIVMSRHIEFDQKNELYNHYQKLDAQFYKQYTTGDLMNRMSEDISKVRMYTGPAIMYLVNIIVTVITVTTFMVTINLKLTLLVFLPLPFLSIIIYKVSNLINKKSKATQENLSQITTIVQETFSAIRVIKTYAREDKYVEKLKNKGEEYRKSNLNLSMTEAVFQPTIIFMVGISIIFTVWIGGQLVISKQIEAGNITEFILYVYRLTWPFASLGWVSSLTQRASASQARIDEFLNVKPTINNHNQTDYDIEGAIEFKNVSYTYTDSGIKALKNNSFKIEKGKTLGIIGTIGSGKTTIANLLLRLYDTTNGAILIDGKSIQDHNLNNLRQSIGYVPQDVFLFSDSISNNIKFSSTHANKEDIIKAAKTAGIYENIMQFPDVFDTIIGERGVTLSGGQKQRISIARALINNPKILILDDCLSAVDTQTEEHILTSLKEIMKDKTSIIISHRISSIKHADKIIVLNNGNILEEGNHSDLLQKKGEYYRLQQLQVTQSI